MGVSTTTAPHPLTWVFVVVGVARTPPLNPKKERSARARERPVRVPAFEHGEAFPRRVVVRERGCVEREAAVEGSGHVAVVAGHAGRFVLGRVAA